MGKQVSREVFADAWERHAARAEAGLTTDPIGDVAAELGCKVSTVRQRSSQLRNPKHGEAAIPLTKLTIRAHGPRGSRVAESTAVLASNLDEIKAKARAAVEAERAKSAAPTDSEQSTESVEGESVEVVAETVEAEAPAEVEAALVGAES